MSEHPSALEHSDTQPEQNCFVVGIGASAGGLRALEEFFEQMPIDSGAAFVVIQHLSPDFKSLMKELLERRTRMAVYRVTEGMELEPNSIYLIPPGKNLVLKNNTLHLLEQEPRNRQGLNFPIDLFLESLAKTYGERAIGVILSGTGSDGTNGLRALNEAGGFTMVQQPESAEFDGMPRTAIATGVVDRVLSPSELAQVIYQLVRSPHLLDRSSQQPTEFLTSDQLQRIASILATHEQTDFSHYKTTTLSRRIQRRYLISGCNEIDHFIRLLEDSAKERAILRHDLLISVTQFFRDRSCWNFLERKVIPELIAKADGQEELRCWVTACATGEEAYSLAMLLDEAVTKSDKPVRFKIFATDIDQAALEKATQGIYPLTITNHISSERLDRYFVQKDNCLQVARKLREKILFAPHDLTKDAVFTRMNLISCRNVLIYLQSELQQQVLRSLHFSLASKGILFLGEAETLGQLEPEFKPLNRKGKIYQKSRDIRLTLPLNELEKNTRKFLSFSSSKTPSEKPLEPQLGQAFTLFLSKYNATCFLVDRENRLFHTFNDPLEAIKIPVGRTTTDITKLIVASLQLPLITALHRAKRETAPVSYTGIKLEQKSRELYVQIEVTYHQGNKQADDFFMIVIQEEAAAPQVSGERFEADAEASHRIIQLEYELQQTRENLQAVIEELETTNEEQQATNEELTASNEELQSTNEELHSVNEELYTVNAEYQSKIEELTELNNDIDNLLRSTDIGVVFLDQNLKIRKFTPAATAAINLVEADINRPLEHITHNLDCPNLIELLKLVINSQKVIDKEVKIVKNSFNLLMRINPYLLEDGRLDGVVVTFIDIDELKTIQEQVHIVNEELQQSQEQLQQLNQELEERVKERTKALRKSEARLRAILETTSSIIYMKDIAGRYLIVNQQLLKAFNLTEEEVIGKSDLDIFPTDFSDTFTSHDRQVIEAQSVLKFEEQAVTSDDDLRTYISIKAPLMDETGRVYAICGISTDISEQKATELELRDGAARERTILNIVEKIRKTLDLTEIFNTTTEELQGTLKCDRVTLYRFNSGEIGEFLAESVSVGWIALLGSPLQNTLIETCLQNTHWGDSNENEVLVVEDIEATDFNETHREVYRSIQAKAFCIIPIFQGEQLWGLLACYQNQAPRFWKEGEIRLITQTAIQLGISIAQVDLFTQIQNQSLLLQEAKEAAEAANHAKSAFIAHTSHELRTPLNAILGFAQIMKREPDNLATQRRGVEVIQQSGEHLLTLINDILFIAKMEAGKLILDLRDFILPRFLDDLVAIIRLRCQQQQIEFQYQCYQNLPTFVRADETRLRQLLLNLLSNAVKFTPKGTVTFKVGYVRDFSPSPTEAISTETEPSDKIRFYIEDTGIGIPQDKFPDIFEPFYQHNPHLSQQEGTGLGLTISKNLAEQMGSQIHIESTVGLGSRFWFDADFPTVKTTTDFATKDDSNREITGYTGRIRSILIVDDLDSNREILVNFLNPLGFKIFEATSGAEAIAQIEQHQPDVMLLDLIMPEMDGWQITRKLRKQPQFQTLSIIIVSASTLQSDEELCYKAGANGFLSKPVNFEQLLPMLEQYLELEWTTSNSSTQSRLTPATEATSALQQSTTQLLPAPSPAQLTQLLELAMQGDIRGTVSLVNQWQVEQPNLAAFARQVRQLAESCQIKKLKQFIRQYLEAV
ncbi:MAG: chemotaxis protein CheB [Microcoleaceae cyanobacterium]